jgi:7-cyano-7-deazaguanine synthase
MKRAVVLFSGGMDSTVNLIATLKEAQVLLAITFDYGQRAVDKEIQVTSQQTKKLNIPHRILKLPFFEDLGTSSLIQKNQTIPTGNQVSIDDATISKETAKSVWVPNRNGIFLNIAAGFAENLKADWIVPGFNREEAMTFPDNSEGFLQATTKALEFSTSNHTQVKCFTTQLTKTEIVALGNRLQVDWTMMWPCYFSGDQWCGECESCQRSKRALQANQVNTNQLFKK